MSIEMRADIVSAVESLVSRRRSPSLAGGELDAPLWTELRDSGFHLLSVDEAVGGSGGTLDDLAAVAEVLARHGARTPLVEMAGAAGWLLTCAGLATPEGTLAVAVEPLMLERSGDELSLSGLTSAPWGRHADYLVSLAEDGGAYRVVCVDLRNDSTVTIAEAVNLAGEPRDQVQFDGTRASSLADAPPYLTPRALLHRLALLRAIQMAAAARDVLTITTEYVHVRTQFGRTLSQFQAVQQHLATLAGQVVRMEVAAQAGVLAATASETSADFAVASAKATTSSAAHEVCAIAHQLHGAIGFTTEHRLGALTLRLRSWRDEAGAESFWHDQITACARESGDWWGLVTGTPSAPANEFHSHREAHT